MNHTTNELTTRPPARKLHGKHTPTPSMPAEYQVGRARVWLESNAGIAAVGLGWVFAFAAILVSPNNPIQEETEPALSLMICALALVFGGVGWIIRNERGDR